MSVAEMRMLGWINEYTQDSKWGNPLKEAPINEKMRG